MSIVCEEGKYASRRSGKEEKIEVNVATYHIHKRVCYRCARARASHLPLISAKVVSLLLDLQQQGGRGDSLKYGSRRRVIC